MAFTVRTATTRDNGSDGLLVAPTGLAIGDVLFLQQSTSFSAGGSGDPTGAGFTLIREDRITASNYSSLWSLPITSTPQANYNVFRGTAALLAVAGADFNGPTLLAGNNGQANAVAGITSPGVTPTYANSLVLLFTQLTAAGTISAQTIATSPPTFTEQYDFGGANAGAISCATGTRTAITATGNGTATSSSGSSNTGQMVILNPAQDGIGTAPLFNLQAQAQMFPFNMPTFLLETSLYSIFVSSWRNAGKSISTWINQSRS